MTWRGFKEPNLDPPEDKELPEPGSKDLCDQCGKDNWGDVEARKDGEMAVASCLTEVRCSICKGTGKATTDFDELIALILMGKDSCEECDGTGTVNCDGEWTKYIGPPDPPDRDED